MVGFVVGCLLSFVIGTLGLFFSAKNKRSYFTIWGIVSTVLVVVNLCLVLSEKNTVGAIHVFYAAYPLMVISFMGMFAGTKGVKKSFMVFVVIIPVLIVLNNVIRLGIMKQYCKKHAVSKIYRNIELPRRYFHEATQEDIRYDYSNIKEGDLIPNIVYLGGISDDYITSKIDTLIKKGSVKKNKIYLVSLDCTNKCVAKIRSFFEKHPTEYGPYLYDSDIYDKIPYEETIYKTVNLITGEILSESFHYYKKETYYSKVLPISTMVCKSRFDYETLNKIIKLKGE